MLRELDRRGFCHAGAGNNLGHSRGSRLPQHCERHRRTGGDGKRIDPRGRRLRPTTRAGVNELRLDPGGLPGAVGPCPHHRSDRCGRGAGRNRACVPPQPHPRRGRPAYTALAARFRASLHRRRGIALCQPWRATTTPASRSIAADRSFYDLGNFIFTDRDRTRPLRRRGLAERRCRMPFCPRPLPGNASDPVAAQRRRRSWPRRSQNPRPPVDCPRPRRRHDPWQPRPVIAALRHHPPTRWRERPDPAFVSGTSISSSRDCEDGACEPAFRRLAFNSTRGYLLNQSRVCAAKFPWLRLRPERSFLCQGGIEGSVSFR